MRIIFALIIAAALPMTAHADAKTSMRNATSMCNWLDSLKLFSGPCLVSKKSTAVDVSLQASKSEARAICKNLSSAMRKDAVEFDKGWKLRIADASNRSIKTAECKL